MNLNHNYTMKPFHGGHHWGILFYKGALWPYLRSSILDAFFNLDLNHQPLYQTWLCSGVVVK
jgi:hypothetical protein